VRKLLAEAGLVRGPDEDALAQPGRVSDRAIDRVAERGATLLRLPALEGGPPICEQCEFVCSGGANVSVEILDPPGYLLATTTNLTNYENRDTPYGCDWWMTGVPSCVAESPTGFGTNWYTQSCSHAGPSGTIDGWSHQVTGHYWNRDFATPARTDAVVNLTVSGPSGGYPPLQVTKSLSAWGEFWYLLQLSVIYWNNFYDDCYS
jgi:hypothetical protein